VNKLRENIPFAEPYLSEEELKEVVACIKSNWLTTGTKTLEFEESFRKYVGSKYAIAVSSCTAALHLSLIVNGISSGDEVITSPLTFVSTINVIEHCGAKPVLVDVDPDTLNIDPKKIEEAISPKTKAIIAVHYGGHPCDMADINSIAEKYQLTVIEDAAHAIGAEYGGLKVGNSNNLVCFSFYPTKNITTGEGGMITTNNPEYIDKLIKLRLHGLSKDAWARYSNTGQWTYDVEYPGFKYNLPDLLAAIGVEQLKKIDKFNGRRAQIISYYREQFEKHSGNVKLQKIKSGVKHSHFLFPVILKNHTRGEVINDLKKAGISTSVLFIPIYNFSYYKNKYHYCAKSFNICEENSKGLLCLPVYPSLAEDEKEYIANKFIEILENHFN